MPLLSGGPNPLDIISTLPQYQQASASGKLDLLSAYEGELQNVAEESHPGGWEEYRDANPDFVGRLETQQRDVFRNEMDRIEEERGEWAQQYWQEREGVGGPLRAAMVVLGQDIWQVGAWGLKAMGLDEAAEIALENRDSITQGYSVIANEAARTMNELDDEFAVTNELYNFASNFFPELLRPDDRPLIQAILRKEGISDDQGVLKQAFNPFNIAGMLGHFARIKTIMSGLGNFGLAAPEKTLASASGYAMRYAVATGISDALELPTEQQSIGRLAGVMGGTYAAMLTGGALSTWAMKQPIVANMVSRLPSSLQEVAAGRVADIGESLANSVEVAIRTNDPWEAVKAFPAALMANMIEEMIIDLPGIPGTINRKGAWQLKQRQIRNLSQLETGLQQRIQTADEKGKKRLQKTLEKLQAAKEKRITQFQKLISKEAKRPDSLFNKNRDQIKVIANQLIQEGVSKEAAFEEAVSQFYIDKADIEGALQQSAEAIEENEKSKLNFLARAGETAINLAGRETEAQKERGETAREQAQEAIIGTERVQTIAEEEEARAARLEEGTFEDIIGPEVQAELEEQEAEAAAVTEIQPEGEPVQGESAKGEGVRTLSDEELKTEFKAAREEVISLREERDKLKEESPEATAEINELTEEIDRLIQRGKEIRELREGKPVDLPITDEENQQLQDLGYAPGQIAQFKPATARGKIERQEKAAKPAKKKAEPKAEPEVKEVGVTKPTVDTQLQELAKQKEEGKISDEKFDREVGKIIGIQEYAIGREGETGIKGIALGTINALLKRDARLTNFVQVNELGQVVVDLPAFKKEYGRDYKGELIKGRTTVYINGKAVIEVANDASKMVAYQEWWNFLYNTLLSEEEQGRVDSRYQTPVDAALGFAQWSVTEEKGNFLTKSFRKVKNFIQKLWNGLKGNGFSSVEDIFAEGYYNPGTFIERKDLQRNQFLTPDGPIIVENHQDYAEAYDNNWVRKEERTGNTTYSVKELDPGSISAIEKDLQALDTKKKANMPVLVEDQNNYYAFDTDEFAANDYNFDQTLVRGLIRDKDEPTVTRYGIESLPSAEDEAAAASDIKNIWNLAKAPFKAMTEFVKRSKELKVGGYKAGDPFNAFEVWTALPANLKKKSAHLRAMVEMEYRRERQRKVLIKLYSDKMQDYSKLQYAEQQAANELLVKGDRLGPKIQRDLNENEMKGYSEEAKAGYRSVRRTMDLIANYEIDYIADKITDLRRLLKEGNFSSEAIEREIRGTLRQLGASLSQWKDNVKQGYIPHIWDGDVKWEIVFGISNDPDEFDYLPPERQKQFVELLKTLKGSKDEWVQFTEEDFSTGNWSSYRLHYKLTDDYKVDRDALEAFGDLQVTAQPYNTEKAQFDLALGEKPITRREFRDMFDTILDRTREGGKKRGKEEATMQALDILEQNVNVWEMTTGWRAQTLRRSGTYGYEVSDVASVLQKYVTGYAGLYTKRDLSQELFAEYSRVPVENKRERQVVENFMSSILHNNTKSDIFQAQLTGWLYHKYIAFNIPFHLRNTFQKWYLGIPLLTSKEFLGLKAAPKVTGQMFRTWRDLTGLETWLASNSLTLDKESDLIKHIHFLSEKDRTDLQFALESGLLDEQLPDEWRSMRQTTFNEGPLSKSLGAIMKVLDRWVTLSDAKNRLAVFLTGTRSGLTREQALEASRKANVVYKPWNVPGFFTTKLGRSLRFLTPFQKYQWHTLETQIRWLGNKSIAPILFYWLFATMFGGKDANPLFRWIKSFMGVKNTAKVRKRLVRALGGEKHLLELWDYGVLGAIPKFGVDMSRSFRINPFSVSDPLTDNLWWSEVEGIGRAFDSARRGRKWKAIFEDNPFIPRYASKIFKAARQATEGITTYRGDVIMDVSGAPLKLSAIEITQLAMGFMPTRLGKHYKARRDARALKEYFSISKSRIGTRYKVAIRSGDRGELQDVRRLADDFNEQVRDYSIGGKKVTNEINKRTLNNWKRGADTKRIRDIMNELYVF